MCKSNIKHNIKNCLINLLIIVIIFIAIAEGLAPDRASGLMLAISLTMSSIVFFLNAFVILMELKKRFLLKNPNG